MEEKKDNKTETEFKSTENGNPKTKSGTQKAEKKRSAERVSLKEDVHSRTEQWLSQIDKHHKGIRINRNDLVNFILLQHAPALSDEELSAIGTAHYNEVRFYTWALKTVREAQSRGEGLTVAMLEKQYRVPK